VDYGDGSGEQPLALKPDKTFDLSHLYADDDVYTVTVRVRDDDGGEGLDEIQVTVNQTAPIVNAGADGVIDEGGTFEGLGWFTDPGSDSWTGTVDYGDGSGEQTLALKADKTFDLSHLYSDNGRYRVIVWIEDDDGGVGTDTVVVTVNNVAPSVTADNDAVTVNEGSTASNTGTFGDVGDDTVTVTASVGTVTQDDNAGTWSWSYTPADGPDDSQAATITATDSDNESSTTTFSLVVENVAPAATITGAPPSSVVGVPITLGSVVTDPGADTFTYAWSVTRNGTEVATGTSDQITFTPTVPGDHVVTLTITDDDLGQATDLVGIQAEYREDLKRIEYLEHRVPKGDSWYDIETTRRGLLTVVSDAPGDVDFTLHDDEYVELVTDSRIDREAGAEGEVYRLKVSATKDEVTIYLANLLSRDGTTLTIHGTDDADRFELDASASRTVKINAVAYPFEDTEIIEAVGGGGQDVADLHAGAGAERYTGRETEAWMHEDVSGQYVLRCHLTDFDDITFNGDVDDLGRLYDTQGVANTVEARYNSVSIFGNLTTHHVLGAGEVRSFASEDSGDVIDFYDSPGDDYFKTTLVGARMQGLDPAYVFNNQATGFPTIRGHATDGFDECMLVGTAGDETYEGYPTIGTFTGTVEGVDYTNEVLVFDEIHIIAKGGTNDLAYLYGTSTGKDRFRGTHNYGRLTGTRDDGTNFFHRAVRFDHTYAISNGGDDVATYYDSSFADTFEGSPTESRQYNRRIDLVVQNFPAVRVYAWFGGIDRASLSGYDPVNDTLNDELVQIGGSQHKHVTSLRGTGYSIYLEHYEEVNAHYDGAPTVTLSVDNASIAENGGVATFTVTLSEASALPVMVDLGFTGTAALADDYTRSGIRIEIPPDDTSGAITVTAAWDELDEDDESIIVDITCVINGIEDVAQQATTTITDRYGGAAALLAPSDPLSRLSEVDVALLAQSLAPSSGVSSNSDEEAIDAVLQWDLWRHDQ
jgi:hypothetical protein